MCVFEYCVYSIFPGPKAHRESYAFLASSYLLNTHLYLLKEKEWTHAWLQSGHLPPRGGLQYLQDSSQDMARNMFDSP